MSTASRTALSLLGTFLLACGTTNDPGPTGGMAGATGEGGSVAAGAAGVGGSLAGSGGVGAPGGSAGTAADAGTGGVGSKTDADTQGDASCDDHVQNGQETDVDCGGPCGQCADGKKCNYALECKSGECVDKVCVNGGGACKGQENPACQTCCADAHPAGKTTFDDTTKACACGDACAEKCGTWSTCGGGDDKWDPLESTCRHASLSIL